MKFTLIVVALLGLAVGAFAAAECAINQAEVEQHLGICIDTFNASLDAALSRLSVGSSAYAQACGDYLAAIGVFDACVTLAIAGHSCTDEATYELIKAVKKLEEFYEDTCGNVDFDSAILDECDDPVKAFDGFADCFGDHFYDYDGHEFDGAGALVDGTIEEGECEEIYEHFIDTAYCVGYVIIDAGCSDVVAQGIDELFTDISADVISICGADFLADLDVETSTMSTTTSEANVPQISRAAMMVTPLVAMLVKMW